MYAIGDKVVVNIGTEGTRGWSPNQTGTIVGYIVRLDKPRVLNEGQYHFVDYYVLTNNIPMKDATFGELVKNSKN